MQDNTSLDLSFWHKDDYVVYHKDIDFRADFRLTSFLTMLQETAWSHAQRIGIDYSQEDFQDKHWVMARLKVNFIGRNPGWMDKVVLATYPGGVDKIFALREFAATKDGEVFALASSSWLLINAKTRQLCRPQQFWENLALRKIEQVLDGGAPKLKAPEKTAFKKSLKVGYNDVDAHRHVNNVQYALWCLDLYGVDHFGAHLLGSFEINFVSEASWSDEIEIHAGLGEESHFFVLKKNGGADVAALVKFYWEKRRAGE